MDTSTQIFKTALKYSLSLVGIIFAVHLYTLYFNISLTHWGIFPRETSGLMGILTAPFVHGSWHHLFSNAAPLLVTTTIIYFFYPRVAVASFVFIYLLTGITVWLFGRSSFHIGASGIVYGLVSFIFWTGIFRRNMKSIILALVVTILYSGYLGGIVPFKEGVSWESHLLGGIMGIFVAFLFKGIIEQDEEDYDPWADEKDQEATYFFPRDVFAMTRQERWEVEQEQLRLQQIRQAEEQQQLDRLNDLDIN